MRLIRLWLTPVLLFAMPAQIMAFGRDGLWLMLALVSGPLLFFVTRSRDGESSHHRFSMPMVRVALAVGAFIHLWASLDLLGELSRDWGLPRWSGVVAGLLLLLGGLRWHSLSDRVNRVWVLLTVGALVLPLVLIMSKTSTNPIRVFRQVSSVNAFRFAPESLWVTEGRALSPRHAPDWIEFSEEHRLTVVSTGVIRLAYSEGNRRVIEERSLSEGQELVVRPGDRLRADPGVRVRFEPGKRIPRAPVNGGTWASGLLPASQTLLGQLGLVFTLFGGAMTFPSFFLIETGRTVTRSSVVRCGGVLLVVAFWGQCWGLYAARYDPELYLDGVTTSMLLRLPAVALHGAWLGQWGVAVAVIGALFAFLQSVPALGLTLAASLNRHERHTLLTTLFVAGAGAIALPQTVPWWDLAFLGFGLTAVSLAPLMIVSGPFPLANRIMGLGLALYLSLVVVAQSSAAAWFPSVVMNVPLLGALPVVLILLFVAAWLQRKIH
jgi:hypothetical protein